MESIKGLSQPIRTHTQPSTRHQAAPTNKYADLNALRFAKFEFFILASRARARFSTNRNELRMLPTSSSLVAQRRQIGGNCVHRVHTIALLYFMSSERCQLPLALAIAPSIQFNDDEN